MSEGDGYRDYDPKERVVELERELKEARAELEEAKTREPEEKPAEAKKDVPVDRALVEQRELMEQRAILVEKNQRKGHVPWLAALFLGGSGYGIYRGSWKLGLLSLIVGGFLLIVFGERRNEEDDEIEEVDARLGKLDREAERPKPKDRDRSG